jgi:hypothetical protein
MGFQKGLLDDVRGIQFGLQPPSNFHARQNVEVGTVGFEKCPASTVFSLSGLEQQVTGIWRHVEIPDESLRQWSRLPDRFRRSSAGQNRCFPAIVPDIERENSPPIERETLTRRGGRRLTTVTLKIGKMTLVQALFQSCKALRARSFRFCGMSPQG